VGGWVGGWVVVVVVGRIGGCVVVVVWWCVYNYIGLYERDKEKERQIDRETERNK
jgi:hypothetical protein